MLKHPDWLGFAAALALSIALAAFALTAFAHSADASASTHSVEVPWGAWFAGALEWIKAGAASFIAFAIGQWGPSYVKNALTEAAIKRAVDFGFATVEGAVSGQKLTLHPANAVAANALKYIVEEEPMVAGWLAEAIGARILARLAELQALPADAIKPPRLAPAGVNAAA